MSALPVNSIANRLVRCFAALDGRRLILWCAFLWYVAMAAVYFDFDPDSSLRAIGLSAIVGSILTLNAVPAGARVSHLGMWTVFRFFLIPFCVASFSGFAQSHGFILIFASSLAANLGACLAICVFCALAWLARKATSRSRASTACVK